MFSPEALALGMTIIKQGTASTAIHSPRQIASSVEPETVPLKVIIKVIRTMSYNGYDVNLHPKYNLLDSQVVSKLQDQ